MYVAQAHTSLLLIDFGVDAIRILYVQKGILKSVRLVPYGLALMMSKVDENLQALPNRSLDDILEQDLHGHDEEKQHQIAKQVIVDFCKQVNLSILFFQKQIKNFTAPARVICLGAGTDLQGFIDQTSEICQIPFEILDMKRVAHRNNIQAQRKIKIDAQHSASLIIPLSAAHYGQVNFLSYNQQRLYNNLLNKQLFVLVLLSLCIGAGIYFYGNYQLQQWDIAYDKSKKEMVTILKEQMEVDVKSVKRVTEIVAAAQSKLEQAKKVCLSFSQSNKAYLQYLQDLCEKIDRASLGLELKKMSLRDKEVILQGKVKDFDALETFEEELMELQNFSIKERPRELTFTTVLQAKEDQDKEKA